MDPRYIDTFLERLSIASYFLFLLLNENYVLSLFFVIVFQMSELSLVEKCYGTSIYI